LPLASREGGDSSTAPLASSAADCPRLARGRPAWPSCRPRAAPHPPLEHVDFVAVVAGHLDAELGARSVTMAVECGRRKGERGEWRVESGLTSDL